MPAPISMTRPSDGRLWAIAFGLSLALNAAILLVLGFAALKSEMLRKIQPIIPPAPTETTVTIFPDQIERLENQQSVTTPPPTAPPAPLAASKPRFTNTSDDQAAAAPKTAAFIGERNTQATSDRPPSPTAPPLPSQSGVAPKNADDFETTDSRYRDGSLDSQPIPPPASASPPEEISPPVDRIDIPEPLPVVPSPAPREKLLTGPNPVDVAVAEEIPRKANSKPAPQKRLQQESTSTEKPSLPKPTPSVVTKDPAFRGNQKKTAIVGSISRNGRSALDVADSPLGRYQAVVSRAVELEWQRNCVRHRDFITPGFLTVQFFVESSGKVRTVQFVGKMETGEVQKGFTLNAIRDAEIPAMPPNLKKEFSKEPLELTFNFYF